MKKQMQTVSCPKSMVGRVIGKNGETIRALQNYTGALIQIDQSTNPMKVTISGATESVRLAISMVTDIVNGTFKGFAMLRQVTNEQAKGDATVCQPVYAPGYGLIPPSQQGIASVPQTAMGIKSSVDFPNVLGHSLTPPYKPDMASFLDMNGAFEGMSLGNAAAAANCTNFSPISSLDLLSSGGLSQSLDAVVTPMDKSSTVPFGDMGLSFSKSALASTFLDNPLELPTSFPLEFRTTSPVSGSISPELSCGWPTGLTPSMGTVSLPANNDLNVQQISEFLKASSAGSYSDTSDSGENQTSSRLSPRSNTNSNVLVLVDPNGRPFTVDVSTGETQWIDDAPMGRGLLQSLAAVPMN